MLDKIRTKDQYHQVMRLIETHLTAATNGGGFYSLSDIQKTELDHLSRLAADYEKFEMKLWPLTVSMPLLVEQKMKDLNLNQSKLAALFNMNVSKLSKILNGKMAPDIPFLKALHEKLGIDGNAILETI
jgi:antitoxin component HigA of HigAB toxin-antitoxin module